MSKMNPSIKETEIGTRELSTLTIYPLSLAAEATFGELVTEAVQTFYDPRKKAEIDRLLKEGKTLQETELDSFLEMGKAALGATEEDQPIEEEVLLPEQMADIEVVVFIIDLIKQRLKTLLSLITNYDTEEKAAELLQQITNEQATDIATIIYEQNFEGAAKKALSLFKRVTSLIRQEIPSDNLKRQSPQSSKATRNTGSNTSSVTASKKGV